MMIKHIESVLLDIDGTLVDSNEAHARSWEDILSQNGYHVPLSELRLMIGMGGDKILEHVSDGRLSESEIEKISKKRDALFADEYLPHVKAIPGVEELLRSLWSRGLKVAFATSMKQELLKKVLKLIPHANSYVLGATDADQAANSKPDPDILSAALRRFAFDRARTALIGDSPYDIEAAHKLPCKAIAVLTGGFPAQMLQTADEIHPDIQHLTRGLSQSLLAS
jgi:HAD superfamily hydrolase (TIGR01509 family)